MSEIEPHPNPGELLVWYGEMGVETALAETAVDRLAGRPSNEAPPRDAAIPPTPTERRPSLADLAPRTLIVPAARATHGIAIADAATAAPIPLMTVLRDGPFSILFRVVMTSSLMIGR